MTSRKIGRPVSRDYYLLTTRAVSTVVRNYDGTVYGSYSVNHSLPWARLIVNNPWREQKPPTLTPTGRTLMHFRVDYAENSWSQYAGAGRTAYSTGADFRTASSEFSDYFTVSGIPSGQLLEQLRTEAILDAMEKVKDQKWNAGVAIAEAAGVATMVEDAVQLIVSTRKLLRKGEFEAAYAKFRRKTPNVLDYPSWRRKYWSDIKHVKSVRRAKRIPQGWLYYNFAIAPTVSDITDAADAYATAHADLYFGSARQVLRVNGYAKQTTKTVRVYADPWERSHRVHYSRLQSVRVSIGVTPRSPVFAKLSELGVTNPAEALYNRLPFSWVEGYFSTFGRWLAALDTSVGWTFATTWSESWRAVSQSRIYPVSSAFMKFAYPAKESTVTRKDLDRRVVQGLYGPMGSILPTFKRKGPSLKQISNLLSVLATSMKVRIEP